MNLVECYVTKILMKPKKELLTGRFGVGIEFNSYGSISQTVLFFDTIDEAKKVKKGYKFNH
jgi:hypothetical protein